MARPKAQDLPGVEGEGVSPVRYKDIDRLGDAFITVRDEKAELATKLSELERKIAEKMQEYGITKYKFSDQEVVFKPGKNHIKIKTVKTEGVEPGENSE